MKNRIHSIWFVLAAVFSSAGVANASGAVLITEYEDQNSYASVQPARMNGQTGIAVVFEGTDDLHYYATEENAPGGMLLEVAAKAEGVSFSGAVYPEYQYYDDAALGKIEVYGGDFKVFVPMGIAFFDGHREEINVKVTIEGIACTSELCLAPFKHEIDAEVNIVESHNWEEITFETAPPRKPVDTTETATQQAPEQTPEADVGLADMLSGWSETGSDDWQDDSSILWYFFAAVLAGLSINIMPCVLPVIPLIIMRLISNAKESKPKRVALGFSFCGGIILFFAVFAAISAFIQVSSGVALELNSIYRNPPAAITLFLFIVLFALVLLDVLVIALPSSFAGMQGGGSGFAGSIGMGFFAGILSTPCAGAVIGAVLVWAQTQVWQVSSIALVLMGVGMALPYAVLVSIPKLLDFVPKPGTWMEIFKKSGGFLLLIIAAKFMLAGLTKDHLINVLMFGVIFAFCVWMWGAWVTFSTPKSKKWIVRMVALTVAVATGIRLLPTPEPPKIDWQKYDPVVIQNALRQDKPVLIKFTADWCTNCKIVDKNVYQDPEIAVFLKQRGFVTVKGDTTQDTYQATIDYKFVFKEAGNVPNTILLNPKTKTMTKIPAIFTKKELRDEITQQF